MDNKVSSGLAAKVEALKEAIGDLKLEDPKLTNQFYLAHWLRGCKLDVAKAAEAIQANRKWRRDNKIDILENQNFDPKFEKLFPVIYDVKGHGGKPVVYIQAGYVDVPKYNEEFGKEQLLRHVVQVMVKVERMVFNWDNEWRGDVEHLPEERASSCFILGDVENISVRSALTYQAISFYIELTKYSVNYFPSMSRSVACLNGPAILLFPTRMLGPMFASKGYRLVLLGTNPSAEQLKTEVFSVITPVQLQVLQARARAIKERWSTF